jgi:hypothetical protein
LPASTPPGDWSGGNSQGNSRTIPVKNQGYSVLVAADGVIVNGGTSNVRSKNLVGEEGKKEK